jgi:hypothetical protein
MSISAFSPDLWVVDMNDILAFGLTKMSIGLGDLRSQGRGISVTYALDGVCLVLI